MTDSNRAYLVRFQRAEAEDCWRASLENAHTGEVHRFPNELALLLFLMRSLKSNESDGTQSDAHTDNAA